MSENKLNYNRTKFACYYTYLTSASVFCLPPLLFVTFREMYGISYTLLGTLVLVNFCTQLIVDLILSFFARHFNLHKAITVMPLLTSLGLFVYAFVPSIFPQYAYIGLVTGTVIFSVSAGLCEVLMSPLIAAIPSDNAERDMSRLHSLYAYGVVCVVVLSTILLKLIGNTNWIYITYFWALLPIVSYILFKSSPMPPIEMGTKTDSKSAEKRKIGLALCFVCIFLGGAAENSMTNWISGYMETALRIPKVLGDIFGMALFAVFIATGRTLYAKYGSNISRILLLSMILSTVCYLTAGLCLIPIISMFACILTGLCSAMLWPGTLIFMEEKMPNPGVAAYALMAAGGDFGSSVAPQLIGAVVDSVSASKGASIIASKLSLTVEQISMKAGMLVGALFPFVGIFMVLIIRKYFTKRKDNH